MEISHRGFLQCGLFAIKFDFIKTLNNNYNNNGCQFKEDEESDSFLFILGFCCNYGG